MIIAPAKKFNAVDLLIIIAVVAAIYLLIAHAQAALKYHWAWQVPLQYLFSYSNNQWVSGLLWQGFTTSLRLMLWAGVGAVVIGALVAGLAIAKLPFLRWLAGLYVESLRHLPPIVFMFIFFFLASAPIANLASLAGWSSGANSNVIIQFILGDVSLIENTIIGILCLSIFEAAFVAEIFRAGLLSITAGQWDGAKSIGLTRWQSLRLVILPQVIKKIASPLAGHLIILVKNSAILSVISVQELTFSAQETAVSTQHIFETWILAALLYIIICTPLLILANRLSR